jgi:Ca2+-binding EF-hand superfamily protein
MGDGQWSTVNLQCSMINENETVILKYYDSAGSRVFTFDGSVTGDANGDGTVDVADIATVISVMASATTPDASALGTADVNGDGTVDVADIAAIIDTMAANARRKNIE